MIQSQNVQLILDTFDEIDDDQIVDTSFKTAEKNHLNITKLLANDSDDDSNSDEETPTGKKKKSENSDTSDQDDDLDLSAIWE